ncbi:hypothetical protein pb186bvf_007824 [Paramecium bursaria]
MKHISSILSSFLYSNNTTFGRKLMQSSLMQNTAQILMTDILYLIECFEGFGPECDGIYLSGQEYLQQFFQIITNKPLSGQVSVKITLTLHLILYEFQIGETVSEEMTKHQLHIAPNQQHSQFVQNYLMYLLKLAQSLKVFYACKIGQYPVLDQETNITSESTRDQQLQQFNLLRKTQSNFRETNLLYRNYQQKQLETQYKSTTGFITFEQKILYLFKLHNLLTQNTQILNLCIGVLNSIDKMDQKSIYIEIGCVLWNDAMVIYKFCTSELCKLLDSYKNLQLQQILSIQQIYLATLQATKSLKWVFTNRKSFDIQNIVKQPFWFEENHKLTKDIQECIIDNKIHPDNRLRIQTPKSMIQRSPANFNQPFSSRQLPQNQQVPFFSAQHKKNISIGINPPETRRNQYVKNVIGNLFGEDEIVNTPRDQIQKN